MPVQLKGMTAFASSEISVLGSTYIWDIKTVNHRYLDCLWQLPDDFKVLESECRKLMKRYLHRGRVEGRLTCQSSDLTQQPLQINHALFQHLLNLSENIRACAPSIKGWRLVDLLQWPGLLLNTPLDYETHYSPILAALEQAFQTCVRLRAQEGQVTGVIVLNTVQAMQARVSEIKQVHGAQGSRYRDQLIQRLNQMNQVNQIVLEYDCNTLGTRNCLFHEQIRHC